MGGRRRSSSDTTTGTLDPRGQTYYRELSVLKKFNPVLEEEDAMLQTFVLEDSIVCDKTGRPVELFTVRTKGPFTIRGRVIIEDFQKSRAVKPAVKTAWIESKACTRYAIGTSDTDFGIAYGAWAKGAAGWYELRPPSAAYKQIYEHTIEGVSLYYTILDIIEAHRAHGTKRGKKGHKKKGKNSAGEDLSIETLLLKYTIAMGDGATYDEVVARCDDHASFLISHFYEDSANFDWTPTSFFKWLVKRHPDIHENVLESRTKTPAEVPSTQELPEPTEAVASPAPTDEPPAQKALSKRTTRITLQESNVHGDEVETHDFATSRRSIRSRSKGQGKTKSRSPQPTVQSPVEPMDVDETPKIPENMSNEEADHANVNLILDGLDELKPELMPANQAAFSRVSSKLYYKYRIKEYYGAAEILKYYASELTQRLNEDEWVGSGFWKTLQDAANGPRIALTKVELHDIPFQLVRRKVLAVPRQVSKSLKTNTGPGAPNQNAATQTPPPKRPGRPAGKMSGLRLVGSKRDADGTPESISRKAAKRSRGYESEGDEAMDDDTGGSGDDGSELEITKSPAALKLVVRAENIPTTDPRGPNGTWVCDEDDCGFIVRNADVDDGREMIQEHLREVHYQEDENKDARINLAVLEGGKNRLPIEYFSPTPSSYFRYSCVPNGQSSVSPFWDMSPSGPTSCRTSLSPHSAIVKDSHLLEKIRQMGQHVHEREQLRVGGDITLPQPIKRRLIS